MATSKQGFDQFFDPEAFKNFSNTNGWNAEQASDAYRRNMETMTSLSQATAEAAKIMAEAQSKYARQSFEDMTNFWKNWLSAGTNIQERMELQSKATQESWDKAMSHSQKMNKIMQESQEKCLKTMNESFAKNMKEAEATGKKASKTK